MTPIENVNYLGAGIMTDDQRVQQLLDRINVANAIPEKVCEWSPELLPVVRDRAAPPK